MEKALIKLAYKQVIAIKDEGNFEKKVFNATYQEFLLKSQAYNPDRKLKTFTQLKASDGRANSLHYKLSFAIGGFLKSLNNKIPFLKDNAGNSLVFDVPVFELVESDIEDKEAHIVAINYITCVLTLLSVIGEYLILAIGDVNPEGGAETITVKMQPGLSIISYKGRYQTYNTPINGQEVFA
ncbi:hypothetical protein [Mucilaginibacter sp. L196]|uniref:hypothetical protein n=1 Tax=Mucilaginibacter sp. L196 TaxID=1641870 RepID=UPI00131AECA0|nr:hypothetical protein [Mucilaginibacter sp. L196]